MTCKFIKNKFISVFQIGIMIRPQHFPFFFCLFFLALSFSSLICAFFFPSHPTGGPLEHFAPGTHPVEGEGGLVCVERTRVVFWYSPTVESSVLGTVGPRANFARGKKRHSRERVLETRKGRPSLFQDNRKQRQEFRAVLFPFSRED